MPFRQLAFAAAAVVTLTFPAQAAAPVVDLDTALRCSAVFGIVASQQQQGDATARLYPPLGKRGREFFVQTGARLMDEQKLSRPQVQARFKAEVDKFQREAATSPDPAAALHGVMTPCLVLLDAAIPAN